jgi:hypothetical protein
VTYQDIIYRCGVLRDVGGAYVFTSWTTDENVLDAEIGAHLFYGAELVTIYTAPLASRPPVSAAREHMERMVDPIPLTALERTKTLVRAGSLAGDRMRDTPERDLRERDTSERDMCERET